MRGYPVTTFDKADYYLLFAYGMGEPRSVSVAAPDYYGAIGWGMGYGGGWGGWGGPSVYVGMPYGGYPSDTATLYDRWLLIKVVPGPAYRVRPGYCPPYGWGKPGAWAPPLTSAWCSITCWWRILRSSAKIPAKP